MEGGNKLTTSSPANTGLVLREQPAKVDTLRLITSLLDNIAVLWQIPNWSVTNSVMLAEWVYKTYSCEPLETIIRCLTSPPTGDEKVYRLTPDVVSKWMSAEIEKDAIEREKAHEAHKAQFTEKLPDVDYESFKRRLSEGKALKDNRPKHWKDDPEYQKFKAERMKQNAATETKTESKE